MSHLLTSNIQKNIQLLFPPQDDQSFINAMIESSSGFYFRYQITQYKNAIYFGKMNKQHQKHGIGILLYDNGDLLIADFYDDQIKGHFFYFDSQIKGMCYFGAMELNTQKLDGGCHIYARNGLATQAIYESGSIKKNWYSKNLKGKIIEHEFKQDSAKKEGADQRTRRDQNQSNTLKTGWTKRKKKNSTLQFISPTDFLILHLTKQPNPHSKILLTNQEFSIIQTQFQLFQIAKNQTYYGILQHNKPNGFGIIFLNDWPVCYGSFINGQLQGLARVQQNKNLILDGIFDGSSLKIGWVLNFQENLTCFGILQNQNQKLGDKRIFQLCQEFKKIQVEKIIKFRRHFHIKSLSYLNYHTLQYGKKIKSQYHRQQLEFMNRNHTNDQNEEQQKIESSQIEQNFIPSYISQISRINTSTPKNKFAINDQKKQYYQSNNIVEKDLIELIKQYQQNEENFQKASKIIHTQLKRNQREDLNKKRSRSKSKNVDKNFQIKLREDESKKNQKDKKQVKDPIKQRKRCQQGKIENIDNIREKIDRENQRERKEERQIVTQRKTAKKLNLQQIYNKYLKKLQKYHTRSN